MITVPNIELVLLDKGNCFGDYYDVVCDECGVIASDVQSGALIRSQHLTEHHSEVILRLAELFEQLKQSILWGRTDNAKV